jgi:hypothetical protein
MNQFDLLPLEVIREHIFPYLDYDGRNAVNQTLLPKWDYIRTPLIKDQVIVLHMSIISKILKRSLICIEAATSKMHRQKALLNLIQNIEKYPLILRHSLKFRDVVFDKCSRWANKTCIDYEGSSKRFTNKVSKITNRILKLMNTTHTYINPLLVKISDSWSAIHPSYIDYKPDLQTSKRFWT